MFHGRVRAQNRFRPCLAARWRRCALLSISLLSCIAKPADPPATADPTSAAQPQAPAITRHALPLANISGLSGMTTDGSKLWLVAERQRLVVEVDARSWGTTVHPIVDLADEVDLESIAHIGGGEFLIGSEINEFTGKPGERDSMFVYRAWLRDDEFAIGTRMEIPFSLWPIQGVENQGIEGICYSGGTVVAGIETVIPDGGRRLAPVVAATLRGDKLIPTLPFFVELSSVRGKLSALDCANVDGRIRLWIIERHFGIARILTVELPTEPGAIAIPRVIANLDAFIGDSKLNFEGIVHVGNGRFMLAVDNSWKTVTGPNEVVEVTP